MRWVLLTFYLFVAVMILIFISYVFTNSQYYPEGHETYTDHFRHLPEAELFFEAYPDARPSYTARYTVGFIATEKIAPELSIHHDRFIFEPERIVIDCYYVDHFDAKEEYLAELIETARCQNEYSEGYEFYTKNAKTLPEVQAFLKAYPEAEPGYTTRHRAGFTAYDNGIRIEASIFHERFDPDPGHMIFDCYDSEGNPGSTWSHDAQRCVK